MLQEAHSPSQRSWRKKYHRPSSCIKPALVLCVSQAIMAFLPFPSIQVFKSRVEMGPVRLLPPHHSGTQKRRISCVLPNVLQALQSQPRWQNRQCVFTAHTISTVNCTPFANFALAAQQAAARDLVFTKAKSISTLGHI